MKDRERNKKCSGNCGGNGCMHDHDAENMEINEELAAARERSERLEAAAEREDMRAQRRIEEAQKKEEMKQAKLEAAAERERIRAEKLAAKQQEKREREMRAEEEKMHRRALKAEKLAEEKRRREERAQKTPGFGGWLAAVVSLSVAVLALGAIVTVGYFDLVNTKSAALDGYQENIYELSEQVEMLDADLAKIRIAQGNYETQKLLADMLVRSRLAERCVENFPVDSYAAAKLTAFFNRAGDYVSALLHKVAAGGTLNAQEEETIEYLYTSMESVRYAMPALIESAGSASAEAMWAADGDFAVNFERLTAGIGEMNETVRGELAEKGAADHLSELETVSEERATELANEYFSDYQVREMRCTGKTEGSYASYTFEFTDDAGRSYYAQITEQGGLLAMFESYEQCGTENFDAKHCTQIARKFLEKCGYENLRPVFVSEAGGECCITFVYEQDGVLIYPDRVMVKVCAERGVVTGTDAHLYLKNHCERKIGQAKVPMERIERNAAAKMDLHGVSRAIIPVDGEERLVYEVRGEYGGRLYFAYIDAMTGETAEIRIVTETDRGMSLL